MFISFYINQKTIKRMVYFILFLTKRMIYFSYLLVENLLDGLIFYCKSCFSYNLYKTLSKSTRSKVAYMYFNQISVNQILSRHSQSNKKKKKHLHLTPPQQTEAASKRYQNLMTLNESQVF